jgi:chromosome segregation ATPase
MYNPYNNAPYLNLTTNPSSTLEDREKALLKSIHFTLLEQSRIETQHKYAVENLQRLDNELSSVKLRQSQYQAKLETILEMIADKQKPAYTDFSKSLQSISSLLSGSCLNGLSPYGAITTLTTADIKSLTPLDSKSFL